MRNTTAANSAQQSERVAVTVIVPAFNSETTIRATLDSILAQVYEGPIEVIVADGAGFSATSELVRKRYQSVKLVANPQRTAANGLNAALRVATGSVVVRCDSHATFPPEYVRRSVEILEGSGAAVVGGRQQPVGETIFERAVGISLTTPLGAGDARYRLGGRAGPADTVYLGVFRRDALSLVGGFNPLLDCGEDTDCNWRLRKHGQSVWFDPSLTVFYRPRSTLRELVRQYFRYGRWKFAVLGRHPAELRLRHLASPLLTLGLAASALLGLAGVAGATALPLLYAATLTLAAVVLGIRRRDAAALLLPVVLPTMHLGWGLGFLMPSRWPLANPSHSSSTAAASLSSDVVHDQVVDIQTPPPPPR